jgi:hypothetical protein
MDPVSLIQGTAGVSFVLYVVALLMRGIVPFRWPAVLWTAAFAVMAVHVCLAFQFVHHWSHRAAAEETARQTAEVFGLHWGAGVFANYALLAVWAVDVARWWRGQWSKATQAFLAFMWFNGVVVFGHGFIRWLGVAAFAVLIVALWRRRTKARVPHV